MRILIHAANFPPEQIGIGKYCGEMSQWLVERGHEVRVVTAPPYYPGWRVADGYSAWRYRREIFSSGVTVIRCPVWVPSNPTGLKRLLHLLTFAASSLPAMLCQLAWRPEVVFVVEPPFFCAPQAWLVSRVTGAKAWLHVQDFEIDAAFALGLVRTHALKAMMVAVERWWLRRFDRVSTISRRMLQLLGQKGVEQRVLFPNWVDVEAIRPAPSPRALRGGFGLAEDRIVVLYSGNMGEKQGLEVLLDAARILARDPRILFVMCGDGSAKRRLQAAASQLPNVAWMPLQPVERLSDLLGTADIHALPQQANAADLVMPSKLAGMLASARPVVATARAGTEVARVVQGCGIMVPPGDAEGFAAGVERLVNDPEERRRLGEAGRGRATSAFDRDAVLRRFEMELCACLAGRGLEREPAMIEAELHEEGELR